jgi:hypothetical protein
MVKDKHGKILQYLILLVLLLDTVYTFKQAYGKALDADIVQVVLPAEAYSKVLKDPFGFSVLFHHKSYAGTNRYFCHAAMYLWFRPVHSAVSFFFHDKVTALYVVSALFSALIYLLIVFLFASYSARRFSFSSKHFLISVLLAIPFIHLNGFNWNIGIIDNSVSYTFFYAFPLCLLFIWFFPFYKYLCLDEKTIHFPVSKHVVWTFLTVCIAFSGVLVSPIIFLIGPVILFVLCYKAFAENKNDEFLKRCKDAFLSVPFAVRHYLAFALILCSYSFYIGLYNSENPSEIPSLAERYALLCAGIPKFFQSTPAYKYIGILLAINFILLRKAPKVTREKKIIRIFPIGILICAIYVLLLPLGGYRTYRPDIIRYDTFMPVTLFIIFYVVFTMSILIVHRKKWYIPLAAVTWLLFMWNDKPQFHLNQCEKHTLRMLAATNADTLILNKDCTILEWSNAETFEKSKNASRLLYEWGITCKIVRYRQQ